MLLPNLLTCQAYKLRSHSANMTFGRISKVLINQAGTGLACISKGKFDFETKIQMINEMGPQNSVRILKLESHYQIPLGPTALVAFMSCVMCPTIAI